MFDTSLFGHQVGSTVVNVHVDWQPQLLAPAPSFDHEFRRRRRHYLDETSWVDHVPGWLSGGDVVFAELLAHATWVQTTTKVWDQIRPEPRLTARWPERDWPAILDEARRLLSRRYDIEFTSVAVNLYRDGSDSVAWHRDRIHRQLETPLVATISLGAMRQFRLRPRDRTLPWSPLVLRPRSGDLIVMGGRCQQDWEHAVPKCADAKPRMSVTIRHGGQS